MKVMVAAKRVLDPNVRVRVRPDGSGFDTSGQKTCINPFDEVAVEQAVRMKEAGAATEVVVVSVGPAAAKDTLRAALALGADSGILVESAAADIETLAVARLLAAVARLEEPDLVLLGKQSIDNDAAQCGAMLAGLLGWSQASSAARIEPGGTGFIVSCDSDEGVRVLEVPAPCVVTADLRLAEPRYATLQAVMAARRKPIATLAATSLVAPEQLAPRLQLLRVEEVGTSRNLALVPDALALASRLREMLT